MLESIAALGTVMQLAFVPRDLPAALDFWTKTMRVGPFFFLPHVAYKAAKYQGEGSKINFSIYIAYWGELQIELIEQHCDSPSIYKTWLDEGLEGQHHICLLVDDIARARAISTAAGGKIVQELFMDGAEAIYVDTGGGPGTMVEMLEPSPDFTGLFDMMRDAAKDWDGSEPVRHLG